MFATLSKKKFNSIRNFDKDRLEEYIKNTHSPLFHDGNLPQGTVKISRDPEDYGTIEYISPHKVKEINGVFSFSFYISPPQGSAEGEQSFPTYLKGILIYCNILSNKNTSSNVFQGWKVIVYTDYFTLGTLLAHPDNETVMAILNHENILFALVDWPAFTKRNSVKQLNPPIMRCMRFRAFFDFRSIPVFVRDADTLFAERRHAGNSYLRLNQDSILQWETNALGAFVKKSHGVGKGLFFFGTSIHYKKQFHVNELQEVDPPLGAYAGFQNMIPPVLCLGSLTVHMETGEEIGQTTTNQATMQSYGLWEDMITYLKQHSTKLNKTRSRQEQTLLNQLNKKNTQEAMAELTKEEIDKKIQNVKSRIPSSPIFTNQNYQHQDRFSLFSNDGYPFRYGRDEQLLLFVLLPECGDSIYFVETDLESVTGSSFISQRYRINDPHYIPRILQSNGSHRKLNSIFSGTEPEETTTTTTTTSRKPQPTNENMGGGVRRTRKQKKRKTQARK